MQVPEFNKKARPEKKVREVIDSRISHYGITSCVNYRNVCVTINAMFVNRFARAFSLHDVLGDLEGPSAVSHGVSQSVFHEVIFADAACLQHDLLLCCL